MTNVGAELLGFGRVLANSSTETTHGASGCLETSWAARGFLCDTSLTSGLG